MVWIVIVLMAALIFSLGCNVKQEYELEGLRADNDELMDALAMLQVRTETRGSGRGHYLADPHTTQLYDSRANAIAAAKGLRCE
jgi:hypothetical protein